MGPPDALEAAHERLVGGVEEDDPGVHSPVTQRVDRVGELAEEAVRAHVDDRRGADGSGDEVGLDVVGQVAAPLRLLDDEVGHAVEQLGWEVVDDIPALVLEDVGHGRLPGTAHAGDDQQ